MMWRSKPRSSPANPWEPVELVILKQKLAKLTSSICKCLSVYTTPMALPDVNDSPNDKEVQVEKQEIKSFDRFTQASQASIRKDCEELINSLTKDLLCPSCFVTMRILRGRSLQILKDEVSETTHDMFSCDKATEKGVTSLSKTTSFTIKQNEMITNLPSLSDSDSSSKNEVRRSQPHVKFKNLTHSMETPPCFCLKKFMSAIRPPILDFA